MPFDTEHVPVRFADIKHRKMDKDDQEISLVEITFEMSPFTKERAKELDDFVRRTLFTQTDAEVTQKLGGANFRLAIRPQSIAVRMAPDQGQASFVIDEAKVGTFHARRSKKSSAWRMVFTVTCAPANEHQLAQIVECYLKSRYLTFANAEPGLFDEMDRDERKKKAKDMPSRRGGAPESAHAH
jgi:hypothetical protein